VGFGAIWFSDFSLIHRMLGVKEMISFEQTASAEPRIEENKPFRIKVDYRTSSKALPDLDWNRDQFLWLDYDDPLATYMLLDARTVAKRAKSGSVLSISVQCHQAPQVAIAATDQSANAPTALNHFIDTFGRDRVPLEVTEDQLYAWQYGALCRRMLLQEIEAELATRNSTLSEEDQILFHQICEIEYVDGAKMTTITGIFYARKEQHLLEECHFELLDFNKLPPAPIRIEVPKLTLREFKKLESQLPLAHGIALDLGSIPPNEANRFVELYRYLPNFAVLEN
jgi:hypothetical protein